MPARHEGKTESQVNPLFTPHQPPMRKLPLRGSFLRLTVDKMLQKMIEIFQLMGTSVLQKTKTQNSFIVTKKNLGFIQNICNILFCSYSNTPKIQVSIYFIKNQYNRLVEIKSLKGYHNEMNY